MSVESSGVPAMNVITRATRSCPASSRIAAGPPSRRGTGTPRSPACTIARHSKSTSSTRCAGFDTFRMNSLAEPERVVLLGGQPLGAVDLQPPQPAREGDRLRVRHHDMVGFEFAERGHQSRLIIACLTRV